MLGLIPDTPETRSSVYIYDYALSRELFDVPLPGQGADETELEEYYSYSSYFSLHPWTENIPYFYLPHPAPFLSDGYTRWRSRRMDRVGLLHRRYFGFDIRNEDQTMVAGVHPRLMEVMYGRFDPQATARTLSTCSGECTPPDAQEEYRGVVFYSWGEDYVVNRRKSFAPPAFDLLGRGGRIAVQDRYVFRTFGTDDMKELIDRSQDRRPSLADVEEYRLLVQGMSELGAYSMSLTDRTRGFQQTLEYFCQGSGLTMDNPDCIRVGAAMERGPMLRRYQVFATGVGKDDRGAYTALVLVHADNRSARVNVGLLRRRIVQGHSSIASQSWPEVFDTDTMEVVARGRALLAKLRPAEGKPPSWQPWERPNDPLLLHE